MLLWQRVGRTPTCNFNSSATGDLEIKISVCANVPLESVEQVVRRLDDNVPKVMLMLLPTNVSSSVMMY